jgi:hypothetical protein
MASSTPTALTTTWVTRPAAINVTPRAAIMGQAVGAGSSIISGSRPSFSGAVCIASLSR